MVVTVQFMLGAWSSRNWLQIVKAATKSGLEGLQWRGRSDGNRKMIPVWCSAREGVERIKEVGGLSVPDAGTVLFLPLNLSDEDFPPVLLRIFLQYSWGFPPVLLRIFLQCSWGFPPVLLRIFLQCSWGFCSNATEDFPPVLMRISLQCSCYSKTTKVVTSVSQLLLMRHWKMSVSGRRELWHNCDPQLLLEQIFSRGKSNQSLWNEFTDKSL